MQFQNLKDYQPWFRRLNTTLVKTVKNNIGLDSLKQHWLRQLKTTLVKTVKNNNGLDG